MLQELRNLVEEFYKSDPLVNNDFSGFLQFLERKVVEKSKLVSLADHNNRVLEARRQYSPKMVLLVLTVE